MLAYNVRNLNDLKLEIKKEGGKTSKTLILDGQTFATSDRFWASISSRFSLNQKLFKFFTPEEVLTRVMEVSKRDKKGIELRLVTDNNTVYGTSDPHQKILTYLDVKRIFDEKNIEYTFSEGQLQSLVVPEGGEQTFKIGPDNHQHRFFLRSPVDGYGNHTASLALLRQVCTNGMVGMTPAFTTILKIGRGEDKNMSFGLRRALHSFSNSDGFTVLEHRVEKAQKSNASLAEVLKISNALNRMDYDVKVIEGQINKASGYALSRYGVTDIKELGKKAKVLPADCTVYDLMNVLTEAATHQIADTRIANRIHALVGDLLSTEYDLEGTKSKFSDFKDLYFTDAEKKIIA